MANITPIKAFNDNYIWLLDNGDSPDYAGQAVVVDPGDAAPVIRYLQEHQLTLAAILITHHHPDHVGGLPELLKAYPAPVYGPTNPSITQISDRLQAGDEISVLGIRFKVLEVPGHTLDHIAFVSKDINPPLLFCGDTLFSGGCGRLFEGSPEQMHRSLSLLAALPADTRVCCAHEYTLANLAFAQAVEPNNHDLDRYRQQCRELREQEVPTLPSNIDQELQINPFLRSHVASVHKAAEAHAQKSLQDPVEVFAVLRSWKDQF